MESDLRLRHVGDGRGGRVVLAVSARAEKAVSEWSVANSFFKVRRFHDQEDLRQQAIGIVR